MRIPPSFRDAFIVQLDAVDLPGPEREEATTEYDNFVEAINGAEDEAEVLATIAAAVALLSMKIASTRETVRQLIQRVYPE